MRLKFWSLTTLDHQNMSKPIPHYSNFAKIVSWAWWGLFCIRSKNFFYKKVFYRFKEPESRWVSQKSKICILSPMAIFFTKIIDHPLKISLILNFQFISTKKLDWNWDWWSEMVRRNNTKYVLKLSDIKMCQWQCYHLFKSQTNIRK